MLWVQLVLQTRSWLRLAGANRRLRVTLSSHHRSLFENPWSGPRLALSKPAADTPLVSPSFLVAPHATHTWTLSAAGSQHPKEKGVCLDEVDCEKDLRSLSVWKGLPSAAPDIW